MKLVESAPKLSEGKIWEIVVNCCKTLSAIGPDFEVSESDFVKGEFFNATGLQGQTGLGAQNNEFFQQLSFNSNLFREGLEEAYLNTIYHELIHVIVNKYLISNNIIEIASGNMLHIINKEEFDKIQDNNGHGGRWLELAVRANKVLGLSIPITPYCNDREVEAVFNASIEESQEIPIEIDCQDCNFNRKFLSINLEELPSPGALMKLYLDTKYQKRNDACKKCGGTLYIIIRDQKFKDFLESQIEAFMVFIQARHLFGA